MTDLPSQTYRITRADLVRYAGASGDFNPIHWSDRTAVKVGLPGVIAHGMLTMAVVGRAVTTWAGAPDAVTEYGVRFTRPVVVPDDDSGADVTFEARVTAIDGSVLTFGIDAICAGVKVLGAARAEVDLERIGA